MSGLKRFWNFKNRWIFTSYFHITRRDLFISGHSVFCVLLFLDAHPYRGFRWICIVQCTCMTNFPCKYLHGVVHGSRLIYSCEPEARCAASSNYSLLLLIQSLTKHSAVIGLICDCCSLLHHTKWNDAISCNNVLLLHQPPFTHDLQYNWYSTVLSEQRSERYSLCEFKLQ